MVRPTPEEEQEIEEWEKEWLRNQIEKAKRRKKKANIAKKKESEK